ncbi:MAG: hypothetical protein ACKVU2_01670 [Saprospiraceae bacterium]
MKPVLLIVGYALRKSSLSDNILMQSIFYILLPASAILFHYFLLEKGLLLTKNGKVSIHSKIIFGSGIAAIIVVATFWFFFTFCV